MQNVNCVTCYAPVVAYFSVSLITSTARWAASSFLHLTDPVFNAYRLFEPLWWTIILTPKVVRLIRICTQFQFCRKCNITCWQRLQWNCFMASSRIYISFSCILMCFLYQYVNAWTISMHVSVPDTVSGCVSVCSQSAVILHTQKLTKMGEHREHYNERITFRHQTHRVQSAHRHSVREQRKKRREKKKRMRIDNLSEKHFMIYLCNTSGKLKAAMYKCFTYGAGPFAMPYSTPRCTVSYV